MSSHDIIHRLSQLNGERATEATKASLIPLYVLNKDNERTHVLNVLEECMPAFQAQDRTFLPIADGIAFASRLGFEGRNAALMDVIKTIDNDPNLIRPEKSKYAIDGQTRPIGGDDPLTNPLVMISRPYCRDGFQCKTHFVTAIIQREDGQILLQKRAKQFSGADPKIDNYTNKVDLSIGAAHVRNENEAFISEWDAHKNSAVQAILYTLSSKGQSESGIDLHSVPYSDLRYLGSTEFSWGNSEKRTFQHEEHSLFHITVSDDWQPQNNDSDIDGFFWVSPEEFARYVLTPESYNGETASNGGQDTAFHDYEFNDNNLAVTIRGLVELDLLNEATLGKEVYDQIIAYDKAHCPEIDKIAEALADINAKAGFTPPAPR